MTLLALNEPFPLPLVSEGLIFEWRGNSGPMLVLNIHQPHEPEISGLRTKAEFALSYVNGLIFILVRAANNALPWCDAPFSVLAYSDVERPHIISEISEQTRLVLWFTVVDAQDNRIKLLKECTFSPDFTQELYRLVLVQQNIVDHKCDYHAALNHVYTHFSPEKLARIATVKCFAGD